MPYAGVVWVIILKDRENGTISLHGKGKETKGDAEAEVHNVDKEKYEIVKIDWVER